MVVPCLVMPGLVFWRKTCRSSGTYKNWSELGLLSRPWLSMRAREALSRVTGSLPLFVKSKSTTTKLPCSVFANCWDTPCWVSCLVCLASVTLHVTSPTLTDSPIPTADCSPLEEPDFCFPLEESDFRVSSEEPDAESVAGSTLATRAKHPPTVAAPARSPRYIRRGPALPRSPSPTFAL